MTEREALKLALEALEYIEHNYMSLPAPATKAITAIKEALAQQSNEQVEPFGIWHQGATEDESDFYLYKDSGDVSCPDCIKLYVHPPVPTAQPSDWSVFNTGAEVASGLTFAEAWDYLTPERLDRGWSAVCVVNKDNIPTAQPKEPEQRSVSEQQEPVAWIWKDGTVTTDPDRADGTWTPLYTTPPQRKPDRKSDG